MDTFWIWIWIWVAVVAIVVVVTVVNASLGTPILGTPVLGGVGTPVLGGVGTPVLGGAGIGMLEDIQSRMFDIQDFVFEYENARKKNTRTRIDDIHTDTQIIYLLHVLLQLKQWNKQELYALITRTTTIYRLKNQIDTLYNETGVYPVNTSEMLEDILILFAASRNSLHDMIYSTPKTPSIKVLLKNSLMLYTEIIKNNVVYQVNDAHLAKISVDGINMSTKWVSIENPIPWDTNCHASLSFNLD